MPASALHVSLRQALHASRALEAPLAALCDDASPGRPDRWTAKDHLVHVAYYRERMAGALDAVHAGAAAFTGDEPNGEEHNAEVVAANRYRAAASVREWANASYERLATAVASCSEAELRQPYAGESSDPVWWLACCWGHLGQHLTQLHIERGDHAAAETVARRVREIDLTGFGDHRYVAVAAYNAACRYALIGLTDDAIALAREAVSADPRLRELAREDPDLSTIHHLL